MPPGTGGSHCSGVGCDHPPGAAARAPRPRLRCCAGAGCRRSPRARIGRRIEADREREADRESDRAADPAAGRAAGRSVHFRSTELPTDSTLSIGAPPPRRPRGRPRRVIAQSWCPAGSSRICRDPPEAQPVGGLLVDHEDAPRCGHPDRFRSRRARRSSRRAPPASGVRVEGERARRRAAAPRAARGGNSALRTSTRNARRLVVTLDRRAGGATGAVESPRTGFCERLPLVEQARVDLAHELAEPLDEVVRAPRSCAVVGHGLAQPPGRRRTGSAAPSPRCGPSWYERDVARRTTCARSYMSRTTDFGDSSKSRDPRLPRREHLERLLQQLLRAASDT